MLGDIRLRGGDSIRVFVFFFLEFKVAIRITFVLVHYSLKKLIRWDEELYNKYLTKKIWFHFILISHNVV